MLAAFGVCHLTCDPETRSTKAGQTVVAFRLASNDRGESVFIDADAWGKTGELIAEKFKKGDAIVITSARLCQDEWMDKNGGGKRTKHKLVVNGWEFVPGSKGGEGAKAAKGKLAAPSAQDSPYEEPSRDAGESEDDGLPF